MTAHHFPVTGIVMAMLIFGVGCTARQLYTTGQAWQQHECGRMIDQQDRERCLVNANTSYEAYTRQSGAEDDPK
ncbi:MAG: hypothetical protein R3E36_00350 [Nitrosomonas sp.]|nr:hypothetical protein [Nitrosomonas sp.]